VVAALLEGDACSEVVRDDEAPTTSPGIRGVPFFVADRRVDLAAR
jgi:predicted DsbA family dithiol-disulfide isomerase